MATSTRRPSAISSKFSFSKLVRKMSIKSDTSDQSVSPKSPVSALPVLTTIETHVKTESEEYEEEDEEEEETIPVFTRKARLNSQSPESEIAKYTNSWKEWDAGYAAGLFDFEDLPPRPHSLDLSGYLTEVGDYRAPRHETERGRQRALDNLGLLKTKDIVPEDASSPTSIKTNSQSDAALQAIVAKSKELFGVGFSSVNLVDGEFIVFMENLGAPPSMPEGCPRDATVCAHSLLAAQAGSSGLVVLDLKKDWRFKGEQHQGFYASHPIMMSPAFGDPSTEPYAVGVMCVMDPKPRTSFTVEERKCLEDLAKEVGVELSRISNDNQKVTAVALTEKRDEWTSAALDYQLQHDLGDTTSRSNSITSIPPPYVGDSTPQTLSQIAITELCPIFGRRRPSRFGGLSPSIFNSAPPSLQSILHLATSLLAESLDLDFVYLLSVDLSSMCEPTKALQIVSSHNLPMPPPLFDLQLHSQPLSSNQSTLLFNNEKDLNSLPDGEFSTGLLVKVGIVGSKGFILGGFSEIGRKVLNRQDFLFFNNFASDISKHIALLV